MKKILFILALFLLMLPMAKGNVNTSVSISCTSPVAVGDEVYVYVMAQNLKNFDSADYFISYNSSILRAEEVYNGSINGEEIPTSYSINNTAGICRIVSHMGLNGINGSGYLSKIKFLCIGEGTSHLSIDGNMSDVGGEEINASWEGKNIVATSTVLEVEAPDTVENEFNAFIKIFNASEFSSINMTLTYDSNYLNFEEIENGSMGNKEVHVVYKEMGMSIKIVGWIDGIANESDGIIAKIKFIPIHTGTTYLNISDVTISNFSANLITAFIENKSVNIKANPPIANFTWQPENATDLDNITFNASSSYDDGYIVNYTWNFIVNHRYDDNGIYDVSLTIKDNDGAVTSITKQINVSNVPPVANFSYSPLNPTTQDIIQFIDNSYDLDGLIVNYTWNFGDGGISYKPNPSHQYADDGIYNVILTIKDNDGAITDITKQINVSKGNSPPNKPYQPSPANGSINVSLNPILSWVCSDPDGDDLKYDVYFGTSKNPTKIVSNQSFNIFNPGTLDYETTYYWRIVAWDVYGAKNESEVWHFTTSMPLNHPPNKPSISGPSSGYTGISYKFSASSIDSDGDNIKYGWDWNGDGIVDEWSGFYTSGTAATKSHSWISTGNYYIKVKAQDENGAESSWSDAKMITITQYNPPPPPQPTPPSADFSFTIDGMEVSFIDKSSDDGHIVSHTWNFGDEGVSNEKDPTHVYSSPGNYSVTLTVVDNDGLSDSITKVVTIASQEIKLPDLVVEDIKIFPKNPKEGDVIIFNITLLNDGKEKSPSFSVECSVDGVIKNKSTIDGIPAGEMKVKKIYLSIPSGKHTFKVVIDSGNNVEEENEENNEKTISFEVFKESKQKSFPLWIFGLAASVVIIGGFLIWRRKS